MQEAAVPMAQPNEPTPSIHRFIRSMPTANAGRLGRIRIKGGIGKVSTNMCSLVFLQVGPGRQCPPSASSEDLVTEKADPRSAR